MKCIHLSDLHIGLRLLNHDLREDQIYIFDQIADCVKKEQPDAILIAGDIYDKSVPSAEAVELFDYFVQKIVNSAPKATIMMISGNHDNSSRVNVFRNVLSKYQIYMIGNPPYKEDEYIEKVTLSDDYGDVHFYLLPFVKPSMIKQIVGTDQNGNNLSYNDAIHRLIERENVNQAERNILVSHQFYLPVGKNADDIERMDSEIRTVGNIDEVQADVLEKFDYAALGHIHKPMKVGSEFYRYCGTPLACSVSEAGQQKGVIVVELGAKGDVSTTVIPLKPKRGIQIIEGTLNDVLTKSCGDYVTVKLSDTNNISGMEVKDRLKEAFPYLLEIRYENSKRVNYSSSFSADKALDPFELCCSFLGSDEEENEILKDVLNTVKGAK